MDSIELFHVNDPMVYSIQCPLSLVLKTRPFMFGVKVMMPDYLHIANKLELFQLNIESNSY